MLIGNYTVTEVDDSIFFSAYPIVNVVNPSIEQVKKIVEMILYEKPTAFRSLGSASTDDYKKIVAYKDYTCFCFLPSFKVRKTDLDFLSTSEPLADREAVLEGLKVAATNIQSGLRMLKEEKLDEKDRSDSGNIEDNV